MLPHGALSAVSSAVASAEAAALAKAGDDHPDVGPFVPRATLIIAEDRLDLEARPFEPAAHLRNRQGSEGQREPVHTALASAPGDVFLIEDRQAPGPVLADRLDQRDPCATGEFPRHAGSPVVFV